MRLIDEDAALHRVTSGRAMIAGPMFVLYLLAMWSRWFIHSGESGKGECFVVLASDSAYSGLAG